MKKRIITLLSVFIAAFSTTTQAQIRVDPYYPYAPWTFGIGYGYSQLYGDLNTPNSGPVVRANFARNANAWVRLSLQYQHGSLAEYESRNNWTTGLSVTNDFNSYDLNVRICIGEFFNAPQSFFAKTIYGIYVGGGVGYMTNNISNITMKFKATDNVLLTDMDESVIKTSTANFYMPVNVGFDLHLTHRVLFNVNYSFCFAMSDYVDGYDFKQPYATNKYNDMFSVLSFGLDFYIGKISTFRHNNYRTRHN